MFRTQQQVTVTVMQDIAFYNYNNGSWSVSGSSDYKFYQYHTRGSGDQLVDFIEDAEAQLKIFQNKYNKKYGINFDGLERMLKLKKDFDDVFESFYNEFEKMKHIVDTAKDEDGNYLYSGGSTTCTFTFNSAMMCFNNLLIRKMGNNIKTITSNVTTQLPDYQFKFSEMEINSEYDG